ncbi:hypothetical protein EON68_04200, partial [archaeon]
MRLCICEQNVRPSLALSTPRRAAPRRAACWQAFTIAAPIICTLVTPPLRSSMHASRGARAAAGVAGRVNVLGTPLTQLVALLCTARGVLSPAAAAALHKAVHKGGLRDIRAWDFVSPARAAAVSELCEVREARVESAFCDADGTTRFLMQCTPGTSPVEAVYIPEVSAAGRTRGVLCVSSQAGCSLSCSFCSTGRQGWSRNLTSNDIIAQVAAATQAVASMPPSTWQAACHTPEASLSALRRALVAAPPDEQDTRRGNSVGAATAVPHAQHAPAADGTPASGDSCAGALPECTPLPRITNVVFMGQGEPLYNFRHVSAAVRILTDAS